MKYLKPFLVVTTIAIATGIIISRYTKKDKSPESHSVRPCRDNALENQTATRAEVLDVSTGCKVVDMDALRAKDRSGYYIKRLDAMWSSGSVVSDTPSAGMISADTALRSAHACDELKNKVYDLERNPEVVLLEDVYIVTFWKKTNPFRPPSKAYALQVDVSAWNGEVFESSVQGGGGGRIVFRADDALPGTRLSKEQQAYMKSMSDVLVSLDDAATDQGEIPSTIGAASSTAITPIAALAVARKEAEGRSDDRAVEPTVSLVDSVYVVTLWEADTDALPEGSRRYDSRVLINAETGAYMGMEITHEKQ